LLKSSGATSPIICPRYSATFNAILSQQIVPYFCWTLDMFMLQVFVKKHSDRFLLLFLLHVSIDTPKRCYYMAQKLKNAMNGTDTTDDEVVRETRFYVKSQNSVDHVNHITGVSGECVGS